MPTNLLHVQLPRLMSQSQLKMEIERLTLGLAAGGSEHHLNAPQGHPHLHLLLTWAATVCRQHGCSVTDFSTSFASGKAICILVHPCPSPKALVAVVQTEATVLTFTDVRNWPLGDELLAIFSRPQEPKRMTADNHHMAWD